MQLAPGLCYAGSESRVKRAVSVMMVCYNSAPTLPWAFGALLAQTPSDWECIFVDDGAICSIVSTVLLCKAAN
jgi:hypothetical protein